MAAMTIRFIAVLLLLPLAGCNRQAAVAPAADPVVRSLAAEINQSTMDSLRGKRKATRYLRRAMFFLETGRRNGRDMGGLIDEAQRLNGETGTTRTAAVRARLLENHSILEGLGCLSEEGVAKLRSGNAPTITTLKDHPGEIASVDHILPRSVAPELDNRLYNLRFMPEYLDGRKANRIETWQVLLAREWQKAGLLSSSGLQAIEKAAASINSRN